MQPQNALQQAWNSAQNIAGGIGRGVSNFVTDLPANSAYLKARMAQKILPNMPLPTATQTNDRRAEENNPNPLWSIIDNLSYSPTEKSMSAQLSTWPVVANTPESQYAEKVKNQVLNSGAFRPAMARYLSTVPVAVEGPNKIYGGITYTYGNDKGDSWETSSGPSQTTISLPIDPNVDYKTQLDNPYERGIIAHELTHATAPVRNQIDIENFKKFFSTVSPETSPYLYGQGLQYYKDGNPPPNAEEFYATLAQTLGPQVMNIPEVRKYYQNIFNQPQDNTVNTFTTPSSGSFTPTSNKIQKSLLNSSIIHKEVPLKKIKNK